MPNLALNMHACLQMQHSQCMIFTARLYSEKAKKSVFWLWRPHIWFYLNSETTFKIDLINMKNFYFYHNLISWLFEGSRGRNMNFWVFQKSYFCWEYKACDWQRKVWSIFSTDSDWLHIQMDYPNSF